MQGVPPPGYPLGPHDRVPMAPPPHSLSPYQPCQLCVGGGHGAEDDEHDDPRDGDNPERARSHHIPGSHSQPRSRAGGGHPSQRAHSVSRGSAASNRQQAPRSHLPDSRNSGPSRGEEDLAPHGGHEDEDGHGYLRLRESANTPTIEPSLGTSNASAHARRESKMNAKLEQRMNRTLVQQNSASRHSARPQPNKMLPPSLSPAALTHKDVLTTTTRPKGDLYGQMTGMIPMGRKRPHGALQPEGRERDGRDKDRATPGGFLSGRSSTLSAADLAERKKENSQARSAVSELGAPHTHAPAIKQGHSSLSDQQPGNRSLQPEPSHLRESFNMGPKPKTAQASKSPSSPGPNQALSLQNQPTVGARATLALADSSEVNLASQTSRGKPNTNPYLSSTSSQQAQEPKGPEDSHRALQENPTALLTSHSASAASKGETPGNSDPKNGSMEEAKVSVPGTAAFGTNPLRNQTSVVPASSSSASATLEVGKSGGSSYREGNTLLAERSASNPFETPQKSAEKPARTLVTKEKAQELALLAGPGEAAGASQGQGNPGSGASQGAQNWQASQPPQ